MSNENEVVETPNHEAPQPFAAGPFVPPTMGAVVRFVHPRSEALANGELWHPTSPAIIVSCTGRSDYAVNLHVFVEATRAQPPAEETTGVPYSADAAPGTWHYPPRV